MSDSAPSDIGVRRASLSDLDVAVDILVESHRDYVWERWALGEARHVTQLRDLYAADLRSVGIPHGEVWMSGDGRSVSVWLHGDRYEALRVDDLTELERVAVAAFGDRLPLIEEVERVIRDCRPRGHWHLATMGTRPSHQRRGLGTAVLGPRLAALDADGEIASLETSEHSNVEFYGRLGFRVVACVDNLPHGAPTTWLMSREPH